MLKAKKKAMGKHVFGAVRDFCVCVQVLTFQRVSNRLGITAPQTPTNYKGIIAAEYCLDIIL